MNKNIILIGMPASGKSTAGIILAKVLKMDFIDVDLVIQKEEGRLLKDIIETEGIDGFIDIENRINKSIKAENTVIATGGSACYGYEAMENYRKNDIIVYLECSLYELESRLSDLKDRGVVLRDGQTLKDLYEERTPLYEKYGHCKIHEKGWNVSEIVTDIKNILISQGFIKQ
ncbi:MAG: shikimate kinase [Lachnospiraceae bacterium]|nr:shikimate kinase [Lachnospiraceae bacterium]